MNQLQIIQKKEKKEKPKWQEIALKVQDLLCLLHKAFILLEKQLFSSVNI